MMPSPNLEDLSGFAVDLGGTKVAAAAVENGQVVEVLVRRTNGEAGPQQLVSELVEISRQIGFKAGEPIGVAVAGRLDAQGLWSAVNTSILKGLSGLPLAKRLHDSLGSGVVSLNDTRAAAIGEYHYGAGQGCAAFAYLTVSTGISVGLMLNGMPLESPNGLLGHVGFMTSKRGIRKCGSGRYGTFESIASGRAIEAHAAELGHGQVDAVSVFKSAAAGAEWAQDLVEESAEAIAELCADLAAGLGIERVVLGGGVGLAPCYLDLVKKYLLDEPVLFRPQVVAAGLEKNSALFGALSVAIDRKATS